MDDTLVVPNVNRTQREVEIKFTCDPAIFPKLIAWAGAIAPTDTKILEATYFDTAGFALHHAGVMLRQRTGETQKPLWCVKWADEKAACLFARVQIEVQNQAKRAIADQFGRETGRWLAALVDGQALLAQFRVEARRQVINIEHQGAAIEIALDEGKVIGETKSRSFTELEMELKSGSERSLLDFARLAARELSLTLNLATKGDRGFGLATRRRPKWQTARPLAALSGLYFGQAIALSSANALDHFVRNWTIMLQTPHPEAIHQSRIALRNFRDLTRFYNDAMPDPDFGKAQNKAKSLGKLIGEARNLDVFVKAMADFHAIPDVDPQALRDLEAIVDQHHNRAYENVRLTMRKQAVTQFVLKAQDRILQCRDISDAHDVGALDVREPADVQARAVLVRRHHDIHKAGGDFSKLSRKQLHALRLRAKNMRCATQFFARIAECDLKNSRYFKALVALQKALGKYNDSSFALHFLKALAREASPEGVICIRQIRRALKHSDALARSKLPKVWKHYENSKPCW